MDNFDIYQKLDNSKERVEKTKQENRFDIYKTLSTRSDFSKYKPKKIENAELRRLDYIQLKESNEIEHEYILRNPKFESYYKLDEKGLFLWQLMDGKHTVRDLLVAYFSKYNAFAYDKIVQLILELKQKLMLTEKHVDVYAKMTTFARTRRVFSKFRQFFKNILHQQLFTGEIDKPVTIAYKSFFKLFFSPSIQIFFLLSATIGFIFFIINYLRDNYSIFQFNGNISLEIIILFILAIGIIFIHEASHAFSCKHFGRKVGKGGIMFYYGMIAAFVDTTDIWMAPKKDRIMVSFAGPYSQLVLAGLASIVVFFIPSTIATTILYQFAFLNYLSVFFNLNPLLELDGYFIFMDWLEIPCLRRKSMYFVRKKLIKKILARYHFTREEKIFATFGILSIMWSLFAIYLGIIIWRNYLVKFLGLIFVNTEILANVLITIFAIFFIIPVVYKAYFNIKKWWIGIRHEIV